MKTESTKKNSTKKIRLRTVLASFLCAGVLAMLVGFALIVFFPDNFFGTVLRRMLPFPAAVVDGAFISYGELDRDRESLRHFYESQADDLAKRGLRVDFTTPEGKKRLLIREKDIFNKLIEDRIILSLARDRGVRFSESDGRLAVEKAIQKESGSRENLEKSLRASYDWNIPEFEERIVRPSLYREALENIFLKERDSNEARSSIEKAAALLREKKPFEEVVDIISVGDSKKNAGDLGWVNIESLVPELQKASREQDIGSVGPILESSIGFHILVVIERKSENGADMVHLRQIFTRKPTFPEWLAREKSRVLVWVLPRRYVWDRESGRVLFREPDLRDFEARALEQSEGDPSLIL